MAKIKSALELALEKTEDITIDKEALRRKECEEKGKRLASSLIRKEDADIATEIKALETEDERTALKKGLYSTLLSYIRFTETEQQAAALQTAGAAFLASGSHEKEVPYLLDQLKQFNERRRDDIDNLMRMLEQQYAPKLEQKKQQLAQQMGRAVDLQAMDDPEFQKLYGDQREQLVAQYDNVLGQIKDQFRQLFAL